MDTQPATVAWLPFAGVLPGHFCAPDLEECRANMWPEHVPRVHLDQKARLTKLTVQLPEGRCVVRPTDPNAAKVEESVAMFGLPYQHQSLNAAVQQVLLRLVRPQR